MREKRNSEQNAHVEQGTEDGQVEQGVDPTADQVTTETADAPEEASQEQDAPAADRAQEHAVPVAPSPSGEMGIPVQPQRVEPGGEEQYLADMTEAEIAKAKAEQQKRQNGEAQQQ